MYEMYNVHMALEHRSKKSAKFTNGTALGCINDGIFLILYSPFLPGMRIICKRFNFNCMGVNQRQQKPEAVENISSQSVKQQEKTSWHYGVIAAGKSVVYIFQVRFQLFFQLE